MNKLGSTRYVRRRGHGGSLGSCSERQGPARRPRGQNTAALDDFFVARRHPDMQNFFAGSRRCLLQIGGVAFLSLLFSGNALAWESVRPSESMNVAQCQRAWDSYNRCLKEKKWNSQAEGWYDYPSLSAYCHNKSNRLTYCTKRAERSAPQKSTPKATTPTLNTRSPPPSRSPPPRSVSPRKKRPSVTYSRIPRSRNLAFQRSFVRNLNVGNINGKHLVITLGGTAAMLLVAGAVLAVIDAQECDPEEVWSSRSGLSLLLPGLGLVYAQVLGFVKKDYSERPRVPGLYLTSQSSYEQWSFSDDKIPRGVQTGGLFAADGSSSMGLDASFGVEYQLPSSWTIGVSVGTAGVMSELDITADGIRRSGVDGFFMRVKGTVRREFNAWLNPSLAILYQWEPITHGPPCNENLSHGVLYSDAPTPKTPIPQVTYELANTFFVRPRLGIDVRLMRPHGLFTGAWAFGVGMTHLFKM